MHVSVGLTGSDLSSLDHGSLTVSCSRQFKIFHESGAELDRTKMISAALKPTDGTLFKAASADKKVTFDFSPSSNGLDVQIPGMIGLAGVSGGWLVLRPSSDSATFTVSSIKRSDVPGTYKGTLLVWVNKEKKSLRIALVCDLDEYLKGVLQSEIPASYHIEALKAQAVAARTYGLRPRIDHEPDKTYVCDSYLCCQYFAGLNGKPSPQHDRAIAETAGQVLTYMGSPALALFSSNAGGHTENFENCFSDPKTKKFPPEPLPYLRGVAETPDKMSVFDEAILRRMHAGGAPHTVDSWSPHFKWQVKLSADEIESNIHSTVQKMLDDPERAPFVVAPPSGKFGHVDKFTVVSRGPSGCAIELDIKTSTGNWRFKKELVIRDVFHISSRKLARLKSARLFFEHDRDALKLLTAVTVSGLGWGHGVGLQQTGAEGWARAGKDYRFILAHYFTDIKMEKM